MKSGRTQRERSVVLKRESIKTLAQRLEKNPQSGRWLFILILLVFMHILMDARFWISRLFNPPVAGFAVLGALFLAISILLTRSRPLPPLHGLDAWARSVVHPLQRVGQRVLIPAAGVVLLLMTLGSCLARWHCIASTPVAASEADMLPLIQQACDTTMGGTNPYSQVYTMPWPLPLTFWPGMWMPYLPFRVVGMDVRWLHLLTVIGISAAFSVFIIRYLRDKDRDHSASLIAVSAAAFLFLFSTAPVFFAGIGHTPPHWAWTALFSVAVLLKRRYLAAVGFGLMLTTRQTSVVLAPLVFLFWVRSTGSVRTSLRLVLTTVATWLVFCGPFLLSTPYNFFIAPIKHYSALGEWDFTRGMSSFSAKMIGFAYAIRSTSLKWLLPVSTVLFGLFPSALAWWRLRDETDLLLHMSLATVAITMISPIAWHYEYFPALLLISFAMIAAARKEDMLCDEFDGESASIRITEPS